MNNLLTFLNDKDVKGLKIFCSDCKKEQLTLHFNSDFYVKASFETDYLEIEAELELEKCKCLVI